MTSSIRIPRQITLFVVVAMVVAVTAAAAMGLIYTEQVSSAALGPDWQCTRLAFVFTSCTPIVRLKTASAEPSKTTVTAGGKVQTCPRRAWRNALGRLL